MGGGRGAYRAVVGKPEGRRPLERPSHKWEDNIKGLKYEGVEHVRLGGNPKCISVVTPLTLL